MPGLQWVRLDSNIASHDKILSLLERKDGVKAAWMYVCALGYSGGHGTDGVIKFNALPFIHGSKTLAAMCVEVGLWAPQPDGWLILNYEERQQMSLTTERKHAAQSAGAMKANCIRWHGKDCGCWDTDRSLRRIS